VGAIAQIVDPAVWLASITSSWNELGQTTFWVATLKIIWINVLLSGDNAVVIALACRGLPHRQRLWGMVLGAGVAVVLRILFTGFVAQLMQLPYLKLAGGLALFYIAAKLLVPEDPDENEVEAVEHLWRAVRIVAVADIIMSLDNVIAIAMAAQGNMALLVLGLGISVPLIVAGAALIMAVLDRYPILVWAGAALLGWIVGEVIATDPAVAPVLARLIDAPTALDISVTSAVFGWGTRLAAQFNLVETAMAALGAVLVLMVGRAWRRSKEVAQLEEPVMRSISEQPIAEPPPRQQERLLAE
jgi:YjbE family integral membrane protein